ncbi:hypothetical protein [Pseudonocardia alaniniphila]|uniref:Uncharacterized protein n=1 Tax=Pseudonocardia alaniniphila TaxID=75291 RepID=A0ABS9TMT6_9PSEU|nr:hypothetical protein [Pseudonocardia alaniniphila]MCH6169852.1 hypothetical protein [Pseudonocardia alaniniphila]
MSLANFRRRPVSRFWLHTGAADNCRYAEAFPTHTEVDCSQCGSVIRTQHTGPAASAECGPLYVVLIDHYRFDCPAIEITRR